MENNDKNPDKNLNDANIETRPQNLTSSKPFLQQQDIAPGSVKQSHLVPQGNRKGDIYYGKDGLSFSNLAIGSTGQYLQVASGLPSWADLASNPMLQGSGYVYPATGGDSVRAFGTSGTTGPYIDMKYSGTTASIVSSTGPLVLTPGSNNFVKSTVLRQDVTGNTYSNNQVVLTGWSFVTGDGVGSDFTKAITFGITFASAPIIMVGQIGILDGSDPTAISDLGAGYGNLEAAAASITTSGFSLSIGLSTTSTSGRRYGASWIAIGTL